MADKGCKLIVIVIPEGTRLVRGHRLTITAEFLVVLIHEKRLPVRRRRPEPTGIAIHSDDAPLGDPLVPASDKRHRRADRQGLAPLLGKAQPETGFLVRGSGLDAAHITAAIITHRMLGNADGNLFGRVRVRAPTEGLRVIIQPRPLILPIRKPRLALGPGPAFAHGEKIGERRRDLGGVCQQQRLALPIKPEIGKKLRLVKVVVDRLNRVALAAVHHKCQLGHALPGT